MTVVTAFALITIYISDYHEFFYEDINIEMQMINHNRIIVLELPRPHYQLGKCTYFGMKSNFFYFIQIYSPLYMESLNIRWENYIVKKICPSYYETE